MKIVYFIFIATGVFIFLLGFILYKYKTIEMLSGYDSTKKYDREGLAKFNGSNLMYMGGSIIIINAGFELFGNSSSTMFIAAMVLFFAVTIFFSVKCAVLSKRYELSGGKEKSESQKRYDKMSLRVVLTLVSIMFAAIIIFMVTQANASTSLSINKTSIDIKAGIVERTCNTNSVTKVYLKNTIPDHSKSTGMGIGSIERGTYDVNGMGEGAVFLESSKGPYLYVIAGKDFMIINNKDASKTKQFYKEILNYTKK
ncbi:MAG: DUF3784 domain-containing protein [Clostridium sp.]|nr:DUF3784 domain-containing protein [Clostridium sp.]